MKKTKFLYLVLLSLLMGISHAADTNSNSFNLTNELILSTQTAPKLDAVQLSCKTYRQTTSYTCGPAAVMVLLNYYKLLNTNDMNPKTELRLAMEMGATDMGTTIGQVENWLTDHDFEIQTGRAVTAQMLMESIHSGNPVLVAFNNHWLLAKGYRKDNATNDIQIIFADSCCGVTFMSGQTIADLERDALLPENHTAGNVGFYIVALPMKLRPQ